MNKKITFKTLKGFIQAYSFDLYNKLIGLPNHIQEQVAYRADKCKEDCIPNNACIYCGCDAKKIIFREESCNNGSRFPDLMDKEEWKQFKKDNNVE